MADDFIRVPVDGPGKRVDAEALTVNLFLVHRERIQNAGAGALEIAEVKNTDIAGTAYGLVVRQAPAVNPKTDQITSADLAVDASVDLDASTIAAGTVGKLLQIEVSSTAPCEWTIKTRDGGVEVAVVTIITGGIDDEPSRTYEPKSKDSVTLAGDGVDTNFRVTATNIGNRPLAAADVHTTIEWDEV